MRDAKELLEILLFLYISMNPFHDSANSTPKLSEFKMTDF